MASWRALNVQDTGSVKAWQERARKLNERAAKAVREAQDILREFRQTAIGNIFEKVVEYSDSVITGMTQILEGMNQILETVSKLITDVINKIKELVEGTTSTARRTVG